MNTSEIPSPLNPRHSLFEHCGLADAKPLASSQEISVTGNRCTISATSVASVTLSGRTQTVWWVARWAPDAAYPQTWNMVGTAKAATKHVVSRAGVA